MHRISPLHLLAARSFQIVYPLMRSVLFRSKVEFASEPVGEPRTIRIPTRHGDIDALLYSPTHAHLERHRTEGTRPPLHVLMHGGAFIIQCPEDEEKVARFLASDVGAYVAVPDYSAAPQAQYPVAEEQCYDAVQWLHESGEHGWDPDRISVGGPSAGGLLALSVTLEAIERVGFVPVAVTSEYGVADMSRSPEERTSAKRFPVVGPAMTSLVANTYFKGVTHLPSVSPIFHERLGSLPPTLIITAEHDTLRQESDDLAREAASRGAEVTHRTFADVDHAFIHQAVGSAAREAVELLGRHLTAAYGSASAD